MNNKIVKYILQGLTMISLIVLIFNAPLLFSSHEKTIRWSMPETACENDEGVRCVVDKYLTQLTVLNPDLTVRAMIAAKFSSSISPDSFANIAIDDNYIYILDRTNGVLVKQGADGVATDALCADCVRFSLAVLHHRHHRPSHPSRAKP